MVFLNSGYQDFLKNNSRSGTNIKPWIHCCKATVDLLDSFGTEYPLSAIFDLFLC